MGIGIAKNRNAARKEELFVCVLLDMAFKRPLRGRSHPTTSLVEKQVKILPCLHR